MKIACDVKGTLEGYKQKQVLRILELFAKTGYEIVVWSNTYSYAKDAVAKFNLNCEYGYKKDRIDCDDPFEFMDFCIEDDRSQKYLAAKNFIFVDDIPEEMSQVDLFVRELLEGQ